MAFTFDELRSFTHFAEEQLKEGTLDSIVQIANRWERERGATKGDDAAGVMFDPSRPLDEQMSGGQTVILGARDLRAAIGRTGGITTAELLAKAEALAKEVGR